MIFDPEGETVVFEHVFTPKKAWETITVEVLYEGPELFTGRLQFRVGKMAAGQELYIDHVKLESWEK